MDDSIFDTAWNSLLTLLLLVLGWLYNEGRSDVKEAQATADKTRDELAAHKLFASENYAKKVDVSQELRETEKRIMDRLGELQNDIRDRNRRGD